MTKQSPHIFVSFVIIIITLLMFSPLLALGVKVLLNDLTLETVLPSIGTLKLLLDTIFFSLGVTVTGIFIAIPAASVLSNISGHKGQLLRIFVVSPIVVPPYLYALIWQHWLQSFGLPMQGDVVAFFIETLARLPLLLAAALIGFAYLHPIINDASRLYANPVRSFFKITLPLLKAPILAGFSIVLLFSINEYGLPSLFMRNTYSLEIFAHYTATGDSGGTLLFALPLVLLSTILAMVAVISLAKLSVSTPVEIKYKRLFLGPAWFNMWRMLALLIVAFQLIIPFKEIISLSFFSSVPALTNSDVESLQFSSSISLFSVLFTLPLAWSLAEYLHRYKNPIIWLIILLVFALPSSLVGSGSILFWSWMGIESIYNSWILLVLGYMTKLLPLSTLFIYAVIRNSDPLIWDAARIYNNGLKLWLNIRLFQVFPGIIGALLVGFSIILSDIELSLLLSPAGMTSVGIRLFNYLHYGAAEQVAYLVVLVIFITLMLGASLYLLMTGYYKRLHLSKFRKGSK